MRYQFSCINPPIFYEIKRFPVLPCEGSESAKDTYFPVVNEVAVKRDGRFILWEPREEAYSSLFAAEETACSCTLLTPQATMITSAPSPAVADIISSTGSC